MSENRKKLTPYIIAFLAGVVITAIVAFLLLRQPGGTAQAGNAEAGNQTENPQTESAQAEDSSRKGTPSANAVPTRIASISPYSLQPVIHSPRVT